MLVQCCKWSEVGAAGKQQCCHQVPRLAWPVQGHTTHHWSVLTLGMQGKHGAVPGWGSMQHLCRWPSHGCNSQQILQPASAALTEQQAHHTFKTPHSLALLYMGLQVPQPSWLHSGSLTISMLCTVYPPHHHQCINSLHGPHWSPPHVPASWELSPSASHTCQWGCF